MTPKPEQRSVALVNNLRGYMNGQIDMLLRTLEDRQAQLEQAFTAEIAHLDDLYSDKLTEDDDALESVLRFDKGYAKTMASIQAATERLVEARAHLARITNTIEYHPAFSGNGCGYIRGDVKVESNLTHEPTVYKLGPITSDKHYPVCWIAIQELMNGNWPFSKVDRIWATGKTIILSSYWQCLASKIDARAIINLRVTEDDWSFETVELSAKVAGKKIDYQPVEMEIDDKIILSISPYDCFAPEATVKETNHE